MMSIIALPHYECKHVSRKLLDYSPRGHSHGSGVYQTLLQNNPKGLLCKDCASHSTVGNNGGIKSQCEYWSVLQEAQPLKVAYALRKRSHADFRFVCQSQTRHTQHWSKLVGTITGRNLIQLRS